MPCETCNTNSEQPGKDYNFVHHCGCGEKRYFKYPLPDGMCWECKCGKRWCVKNGTVEENA